MAFLIIIVFCYVVVALIRRTKLPNEFLPIISGVLGLLLGVAAFYAIPSLVPVDNVGLSLAYGFFCGLASTGGNQVFKQAVKFIKSKYNINIDIPEISSGNGDTQSEDTSEKEK